MLASSTEESEVRNSWVTTRMWNLPAVMAAGLVDRVQVTLFGHYPSGRAGPDFQGAADFDLELVEHRTLDGHIQGDVAERCNPA
jgi:hypothetical protein